MSGLKLKKTWAVLLIALLLIFVSACSTPDREVAEEASGDDYPGRGSGRGTWASSDDSETAQKDEPAETGGAQDDVPYARVPESLSPIDPEEILKAITTAVDMPL